MSGQGIGQILVYIVVLVALGYPMGIYMARVYTDDDFAPRGRLRGLGAVERGFFRAVRVDGARDGIDRAPLAGDERAGGF